MNVAHFGGEMLVIQLLVYGAVSFWYHDLRASMSPEERKAFDEQTK
jgi:hypothetical protein